MQRAGTLGELRLVVQSFLASCEKSETEILSAVRAPAECCLSEDIKESVIHLARTRVTVGVVHAEIHQHVKALFDFYTDAASRLGHLEFASRCETR